MFSTNSLRFFAATVLLLSNANVLAQTTADSLPTNLATGAAPICFSLAGTTTCTAWKDNAVQSSQQFTNVATFDNYIKSLYDNTTVYLNQFRTENNCPTWSGQGRRYHISFLCGMILDVSTVNGCNPTTKPKPLCRKTVEQAVDSLNAIFSDPKSCNQTVPRATPPDVQTFVGRMTADTNCVPALEMEWTMCGFWSEPEVTPYCGGAANTTDLCCSAHAAKLSSAPVPIPTSIPNSNPQRSAPTDTASATGTAGKKNTSLDPISYSKPSTPVIIGASVAGVVVLAAIAAGLVYTSKHRIRQSKVPDGFLLTAASSSRDGSLKYNRNLMAAASNSGPRSSPDPSAKVAADATLAAAQMMGVELPTSPTDSNVPIQIAETMEVIYNYVPNLADEIYLYIGDPVIVKCKFDDGWGYGFNMTTKMEGSFPLACVAPYNSRDVKAPLDDQWEAGSENARWSKRESSLGRNASGLANMLQPPTNGNNPRGPSPLSQDSSQQPPQINTSPSFTTHSHSSFQSDSSSSHDLVSPTTIESPTSSAMYPTLQSTSYTLDHGHGQTMSYASTLDPPRLSLDLSVRESFGGDNGDWSR